jgi:hypothetical protein
VEDHLNGQDVNTIQNTAALVSDQVGASIELHIPVWAPLVGDTGTSEETAFLPEAAATPPGITNELLADSFLNLPSEDLTSDEFRPFYDGSQEEPAFDTLAIPQDLLDLSLPSTSMPPSSSAIPTDALSRFRTGSSLLSTSRCDTETTLCSEAYEMLRQHNKKGVDMIEIGIRLWNGFTKGDGSGCKVENKLLFSVLEYVSG